MQGKRRLLSMLLTLCMVVSFIAVPAVAAEFEDMPAEDDWSYAALDAAVENGLLQGTDGRILPGTAVSRAQFAAILSRAFGATAQADISGYTDAAKSDWYYADMAKAVGMKALAGNGAQLRPEELITRQETFVALARALKLAPGNASALDAYTDGGRVASWAVEGVAALAGGKYIEGANGMLNPLGTITRAELAQVLYKLIPAYVSTAGTYSEAVTGNLMVNAPGVTLKGITVPGDLILGDGVGEGDVTLSGVTVHGRLVIRGGGAHSIKIINNSSVGTVVLGKTADGQVRVLAERGSRVAVVEIADGKDDMILEGSFDAVKVDSSAKLVLRDATVSTLTVRAEKAAVALEGKTAVTTATVEAAAEGASLNVSKDAQITKVDSAAPKAEIKGDGKVTEAKISGGDTKITTPNTTVTVDKGTSGVTVGDKVVEGGSTTVNKPTPPTGGGNSGGSTATSRTVKDWTEFMSAMSASDCNAIIVDASFGVGFEGATLKKPLTINGGKTLTVDGALGVQSTTLTNNGTLVVQGYLALGDMADGVGATLVNNGTITVNDTLELYAGSTIKSLGTIAHGIEDGREIGGITLTDVYTSDTPRLWGEVAGLKGFDRAAVVNSEVRLRTALASSEPAYNTLYLGLGGVVALAKDLTVPADKTLVLVNGGGLTVPEGRSLLIESGGFLRINGDLVVEGTATNRGEYYLASIGTLTGDITDEGGSHTANYTVKTQADWDKAVADASCRYINVDAGAETITMAAATVTAPELALTSGTLAIPTGATVTATSRWELNPGTTLTNAGTLTVAGAIGINGTLINSGTLNLKDYAYVEGELQNSGTLAVADEENANFSLHGATLTNTDSGTITRGEKARFWMENTAFTSATALNGLNGVEISDLFDSREMDASEVPEGVELMYYDARIGDEAGLTHYQTATLPMDDVRAHIEGDVSVTKPLTLLRHLDVNGGWPDDMDKTPFEQTLTVAGGALLTLETGVELNVGDYGVLDVKGGIISKGRLSANCWDDENNPQMKEQPGKLLNNGSITVEEREETEDYNPSLSLDGGLLINQGSLVNKCDLNVNGGELDFRNGSISTSRSFAVNNGGTLKVANGCKINNNGYMELADEYPADYESDSPLAVKIPEGEVGTWLNSSDGEYERTATVWNEAGLTDALAATAVNATNPDHPGKYWPVRVQGEITWGGTIAEGSRVMIEDYWTEEGQQDGILTLNATTINGELEIRDNAEVKVAGTVTLAESSHVEVYGKLSKSGEGRLEGEGVVKVECVLDGSGNLAEGQPYVDEGLTTNVERQAIVTTLTDFTAANTGDTYSMIRIQQVGDTPVEIELNGDVTTTKAIGIFQGNQLAVPSGASLTLQCGAALSTYDGTLQVYGAMVIESGARLENIGGANINVGNNVDTAKITNSGEVYNGARITVMNNATLEGVGVYSGEGEIINNNSVGDSAVSDGWKTAQAPAPEP